MARAARQKAESGFYHIMLRGAGKQCLFEDDADRCEFLRLMGMSARKTGVDILAWCLMDNHVHIVISDPADAMSECLHALAGTYAAYFNGRTAHVGHVFQDRFKSKPIEDAAYLLEAVRYVHNNPAEAGVCAAMDYRWSSYREYLGRTSCGATPEGPFADTSLILDMLGGIEKFVSFHEKEAAPDARRYSEPGRTRMSDDAALETARKELGSDALQTLKQLGSDERRPLLRRLHAAGLSIRQIERVTGIGRWSVERALG